MCTNGQKLNNGYNFLILNMEKNISKKEEKTTCFTFLLVTPALFKI